MSTSKWYPNLGTKFYVKAEQLEPLEPHTNPAYHDMFSMYTTVGQANEVFVMFQEEFKMATEDGETVPHMKRLVLYHAPTGERIAVNVDTSWVNDPKFDREKAEARVAKEL